MSEIIHLQVFEIISIIWNNNTSIWNNDTARFTFYLQFTYIYLQSMVLRFLLMFPFLLHYESLLFFPIICPLQVSLYPQLWLQLHRSTLSLSSSVLPYFQFIKFYLIFMQYHPPPKSEYHLFLFTLFLKNVVSTVCLQYSIDFCPVTEINVIVLIWVSLYMLNTLIYAIFYLNSLNCTDYTKMVGKYTTSFSKTRIHLP